MQGERRPQSLIEARFAAQRIAFGPIIFQVTRLLRDLGILETLRAARAGLIRQIEAKALRKLRHPSRSERLKSFLDQEE